MRNCKICIHPEKCDCLCDTCKLARILSSMPDWVYEASDYTRRQWIAREMQKG